MNRSATFLLTVLSVCAFGIGAARADEPRLIQVFQNWSAYTFNENGHKVCYMAERPKKSEGVTAKTHRGEVFALITDRPAEGSKNVFSYITGYGYKAGSDVIVTIDKQHFTLFTQDDTAWAPDGVTDNKIADAIRKGAIMTVKGTSTHGTETVDSFELAGSGSAFKAITGACSKK